MHKPGSPRDLSIVGEFIKFFLLLFVPFFIVGFLYGIFTQSLFMSGIVNPIIYAGGISSIIIIFKHDVNDILALIGQAKEPDLALHIKHSKTIQMISVLMSSKKYDHALETVNRLLKDEPRYPNALNLKGQILLDGFSKFDAARSCFNNVMDLTDPDNTDYKLAETLKAAAYTAEEV